MKQDTWKLIEEKVGDSLEHIVTEYSYINTALIVKGFRSTVNKWDFMKLKSFCKVKDIINRTK